MSRPPLHDVFSAIPASVDDAAFRAEEVGPSVFIARSSGGQPILLVEQERRVPLVPLELRHVVAHFNLSCEVVTSVGSRRGMFSVLQCRDADDGLRRYFLWLCERLLDSAALPRDWFTWLTELVELLRSLDTPALRSIRGIFGELVAILASDDPALLVRCWHALDYERFDFALGASRIEVKTCPPGRRVHHFSLSQLVDPDLHIVVVSIIAEVLGGGVTVQELAEEVRSGLTSSSVRAKFENVLAQTLGRDWEVASAERFDYQLARRSLRVLNASDVPRVSTDLPAQVADVRFTSDVEDVPSLDAPRWGAMIASLPRM